MQQCVHYLHRLLRPHSSAAKSFTFCLRCVCWKCVCLCVCVCVQRDVNIYAVANRRHWLAVVLFLGMRCDQPK